MGDSYGNRVDRFLSTVAYLDGENPSVVFCRGYYTRTCLTAYDFVEGKLIERWVFDSNVAGKKYEGQGNHSLYTNDIDNDGKDEIVYGALVIDDDGTVKYSTGLGHGDAMHVFDIIPSREGLEIFSVHEEKGAKYQVEIRDAETGEIIYGYFTGVDTGRGLSADIDPTAEGAEFWANAWDGTNGGLYSSLSTFEYPILLSQKRPSINFNIYWDGDLLSELQNHTFNSTGSNYHPVSTNITKWDYENEKSVTLLESAEIFTSNGTKGNVGLVADIIGDWREEIVARSSADDSKIRIYSTTIKSDYSIPTFMEDHAYRLGIANQNVAYNQPAHTSYLISEGLKTANVTVESTTMDSVHLAWTKASDGIYGHNITGYMIYRFNAKTNKYETIGTIETDNSEDIYRFADENLEQNVEYTYKVAAIVDNTASFRSSPVTAITALEISAVQEFDAIELVQDIPNFLRNYQPLLQ